MCFRTYVFLQMLFGLTTRMMGSNTYVVLQDVSYMRLLVEALRSPVG